MQKIKIILIFFLNIFIITAFVSADEFQGYDRENIDFVHVSLSNDGNMIIAGDPKTGIVSLVSKEGIPIWAYKTVMNISGVAISGNGEYISCVSEEGNVLLFDNSGNFLWESSIKGCSPKTVLSENGSLCLVFNEDLSDDPYTHTLHIFDKSGKEYFSKRIPGVDSAVISSDEDYFFTGSSFFTKGRLHSSLGEELWDYKTGLTSYFKANPRVDASDNFNTIGIAGDDKIICFDKSGSELFSQNVSYWGGSVLYIAVSGSGEYIVAGDRHISYCINRTGSVLWNLNFESLSAPETSSAAFSCDGSCIAICHDNQIFILENDGKLIKNLVLDYPLLRVFLSDDGKIITGGTYGSRIYINSGEDESRFIDISNFSTKELPLILKKDDSKDSLKNNPENVSSPVYFLLPYIAIFLIIAFRKRNN